MKPFVSLALVAALSIPCVRGQAPAHHNQQVTGNNNKVSQVNITIQRAAKAAGEPGSWDRMLLPGNLPIPRVECEESMSEQDKSRLRTMKATFKVYYGGGMSFCSNDGCNLVTAESKRSTGESQRMPLIRVDRLGATLVVTAKLFDEDGKIAAELDKGKIYKNESLVAYIKRPDPSTLTVVDNFGNALMTVRYLNESALSMEGVFYKPSESPAVPSRMARITPDQIVFNEIGVSKGSLRVMGIVSGNCTAGLKGSAFVF